MLTKADLDEFEHLAATTQVTGDELRELTTPEEVLAYAATAARSLGGGEADLVELIIRSNQVHPDEVRRVERTLRRLGYVKVCDRLREIAGRRKHSLRPLAA
jgi:hypothetical protein